MEDWGDEKWDRGMVFRSAHRLAMKLWICADRTLDPDSERDMAEVLAFVRSELGGPVVDALDPELVREEIRAGMVEVQPRW